MDYLIEPGLAWSGTARRAGRLFLFGGVAAARGRIEKGVGGGEVEEACVKGERSGFLVSGRRERRNAVNWN